jgi:uncharacterized RDD family membrane protein YckC
MEPYPTTTTTATGKAPLGKRAVAVILDSLIAGALGGLLGIFGDRMGGIGALLGAGYMLVRDGLALEFASGRSVGKQLMGLTVVRLDGRPMDMETSIRRNWTLVIGSVMVGLGGLVGGAIGAFIGGMVGFLVGGVISLIELVLVFTDARGRRIGDKTGGTEVVEASPI